MNYLHIKFVTTLIKYRESQAFASSCEVVSNTIDFSCLFCVRIILVNFVIFYLN